MNENLYIAHKKLPHKTLHVHSARYTQCIHVSSRKLKLPKDTHTKRYKQLLPTHPFQNMGLYIAVKCKNIYRVTNNDNNNKNNFFLLYIHRDRRDYWGWGAQDVHLDFRHTQLLSSECLCQRF